MLIPSRRLVMLSIALCLAGLLVSFFNTLAPVWLGMSLVLLLAAIIDAALGLRLTVPAADRLVPGSLPRMKLHPGLRTVSGARCVLRSMITIHRKWLRRICHRQ